MHRVYGELVTSFLVLSIVIMPLCELVTWGKKTFGECIVYLNAIFGLCCFSTSLKSKMFLLSSYFYPVSAHLLEENEVRTMVDPNSKNDRKLQELMKVRFQ